MPIIDASAGDLTGPDALMRWVTDELITNHRFTSRWGSVNGTSVFNAGDTIRWLDRPASETFYGDYPICIGLRESISTRSQDSEPIGIGMQIANDLFNNFWPVSNPVPWSGTGGGGTDWIQDPAVRLALPPPCDRNTGACTGTIPAGNPIGVDKLTDANSPFIRARMITNPTSTSATPSEPFYCYVVVEYQTGYFRKFGFGELLKYYPFDGGIFALGDIWGNSSGAYANNKANFAAGSIVNIGTSSGRDESPGNIFAPGWNGILTSDCTNGRGWMSLQPYTSTIGNDPGVQWPAMGWTYSTPLIYFGQSPSSFSLQSERVPAVLFGGNQKDWYQSSTFEIHPMGQFPDLYQAVVTDIDAYGVFQDQDGSKFMCVPHFTKLVSEFGNGSGRHGIFIKNPGLTVTIT